MRIKQSKINDFPYQVFEDSDGYGSKGEGVYSLGASIGTIYAGKPQQLKKVSEAQALMADIKDTFRIEVIKSLSPSVTLKQRYLLRDSSGFTYRILNDPTVLNSEDVFTLIIEET